MIPLIKLIEAGMDLKIGDEVITHGHRYEDLPGVVIDIDLSHSRPIYMVKVDLSKRGYNMDENDEVNFLREFLDKV